MLVTLLPGESTVFRVTGAVIEAPEALGTRPALRCVNDTIAQPSGGPMANHGALGRPGAASFRQSRLWVLVPTTPARHVPMPSQLC